MAFAKLSATKVNSISKPGLHSDGGGLYLKVTKTGTKSWIFRWRKQGKLRDMGLGSLNDVTLKTARQKAADARTTVAEGLDPIIAREQELAKRRAKEDQAVTFSDCANSYIEVHSPSWQNSKHRQQWSNTLATYANPIIGDLKVCDVSQQDILNILQPIWTTKTETATRVRQRLEKVIDYAITSGARTGENPARWRGHLEHLLPTPTKVRKVRHHPALPYKDIPDFISRLSRESGTGYSALLFTVLTATRTSETIGATWAEFDIKDRVWVIPSDRMKARLEHRVPLSGVVLSILEDQQGHHKKWVFPSTIRDKHLSNAGMSSVLRRIDYNNITVHGFRSSFRDWAAEQTSHPFEVCEMALAHTIRNASEAAYRRGDLFEKRAVLMKDWSSFCYSKMARKQ